MAVECICDPITKEGYQYVQWIGTHFNQCVYTPTQRAGFAFGMITLCIYLVAQLPQLWQNYRRKSVEGLSIGFLLVWLIGDITNLAGALLTDRLPLVKGTGYYFCAMDVIILSQYAYYSILNRRRRAEKLRINEMAYAQTPNTDGSAVLTMPMVASMLFFAGLALALPQKNVTEDPTGSYIVTAIIAPLCKVQPNLTKELRLAGSVFAWISGMTYFLSRIPQLVGNFKRKSTDGVSVLMFILTVLGNTLFGLQIIMDGVTWNADFIADDLPYIIGSMGTLIFDFIFLYQAYIYKENKNVPVSMLDKDFILPAKPMSAAGGDEKVTLIKSENLY